MNLAKKIVSFVVFFCLNFSIIGCSSGNKTVDLMDGVSIEATGFDGSGKVQLNHKSDSDWELRDLNDQNNTAFFDSIHYKIDDEKQSYTNGDKIKVIVEYNENAMQQAKLTVTNTEKEFEVTELTTLYTTKEQVEKFNRKFTEQNKEIYDHYIQSIDDNDSTYSREKLKDSVFLGNFLGYNTESSISAYLFEIYYIKTVREYPKSNGNVNTLDQDYLLFIGPKEDESGEFTYSENKFEDNGFMIQAFYDYTTVNFEETSFNEAFHMEHFVKLD